MITTGFIFRWGYLYCIGNPRTDWLYSTEADPGLNGRQLRYPRGRVLGGCSSINGMIYMRGQSRDYDGWADATGDDAWRWGACLPYFLRHEDHWRGADELHAAPGFDRSGARAGGEWRVERQRLSWEILDAFAQAAQQAGIPATSDFNRGSNEGVGYFEVNQRGGVRWNTTKAFLRPAMRRSNLRVQTGALTTRLVLERAADGGQRAVGVEWRPAAGGAPQVVRAAREVVMCAGAIGTPQILQLSGIGPAPLLHEMGVPVAARAARRGREPAGPPADPCRLRGRRREDAQHHGAFTAREGADRPGIPAAPQRADEHGAVAAGRLHAQRAALRLAQRRIPRSAAVAGRLRPAAAPLQRLHRQRLQPQPDGARPCADPLAAGRGRAAHPGQLPLHAGRPPGRRRLAAPDAPHRRHAGAGPLLPARGAARRAVPERRRTGAAGRRHRHHHLPSRGHLPHGPRRRPGRRGRPSPAPARRGRRARGGRQRECPASPAATPIHPR